MSTFRSCPRQTSAPTDRARKLRINRVRIQPSEKRTSPATRDSSDRVAGPGNSLIRPSLDHFHYQSSLVITESKRPLRLLSRHLDRREDFLALQLKVAFDKKGLIEG